MNIRQLIRWRDWNIATKLSLLFIAATFLGLAGLTLAADARARSDVLAQARINNLQRARATAQLLDFYLDSVTTNVQLIAVAPGTLDFLDSAQRDAYREGIAQVLEFARARGGYDAVFLLDPLGNVLIATDAQLVGRNYTTASWFRNATAGRTTFDEPRYDAVDNKVFLYVSAPVTTPRGQVVGAAVARLTLEPIDQIIAADVNYDGRGAFGVLQDENGIRLSHSTRQDVRFKPAAPLPADLLNEMVFETRYGPDTAAILGNPTDFAEMVRRAKLLLFDRQTDPYLSVNSLAAGPVDLAMAPLKNKRWIYSVGTPQASLMAEVNQQTQGDLIQAMVVGVIALVTSLIAARWLTRPIRRVAAGANAIAAGDLSHRIGLNQRDEVGQLAVAFDAMADALEKKDAALRKHAAELQIANQELESFSYSVSHDLRAPLRSIDGFSHALLEDYAADLNAEAKQYLERVRANTQRMAELIDALLILSRVTRAEMRRERVDLSALAHSIAAELQSHETPRQVEWIIAEGVVAQGDARLLRIALENLLGNAWKFTSARPTATIEFGMLDASRGNWKLEVGSAHPTSNVQLPTSNVYFVRDNGAGFAMEYADKLFSAFQRLHSASEFPGTGIGLATVQRIIHRHGGTVWAEAVVDQGATFYFTVANGGNA